MNIVKAKRILESTGCKLIKEWSNDYDMGYGDSYMDKNDYEEQYCPVVGDKFDKIVLKMKENLNNAFPGTEIKETNVEFEDVDTMTDYPEFSCKTVFRLSKELTDKFEKLADDSDAYTAEFDKLWEIAKSGIRVANDSWYYEGDFDGSREIMKIQVPCTVKEENDPEGGYSRAFIWK